MHGLTWSFGSHINAMESDLVCGKFCFQVTVNPSDIGQGEVTASDTGLIGDEEERISGCLELLKTRHGTWQQDNLTWIAQVMALFNEGPVAVEEHRAAFFGAGGYRNEGHREGQWRT